MSDDYEEFDIKAEEAKINAMSHEEMARLWRFGESGHIYFDSRVGLFPVFKKRFIELGGMTTEISKKIGW
jgi:hypothetical protein